MALKNLIKDNLWALADSILPIGALGAFMFAKEQKRQIEHNKKVWETSHLYRIEEIGMWIIDPTFLQVCWAIQGGAEYGKRWPCDLDEQWADIDHGYEIRYD